MSDIETLLKATICEMEKLLTSKTIIGEPITAGKSTVVPLLSVGAGFGAGVGHGKSESNESSGGAGGGFGMKPIAVIIIEEDEVRVEPIREGKSSLIGSVLDNIPQLMRKEIKEWEKEREDKKKKKIEKEVKVE